MKEDTFDQDAASLSNPALPLANRKFLVKAQMYFILARLELLNISSKFDLDSASDALDEIQHGVDKIREEIG